MAFDRCSILHDNLTPSATLSGGSWLSGLPLNNLKTTELAAKARSTTDATADTKIQIDHGSAVSARVIWLAAHNLSSAAQMRVLRGTSSGGSQVYSGTLANVWHISPSGATGETYGAFIILPTSTSARYTTVEIEDTTNPAGYVEIGQMLIGDVYTFTYGPAIGLQHALRDLSTVAEAESGAPWVTERRKQRGVSMVLEGITDTEADALQDIRQTIGTHGQVVYLPSLTDSAQTQRFGCVSRLSELSAIEYPYARYRSLPIRLTEWL